MIDLFLVFEDTTEAAAQLAAAGCDLNGWDLNGICHGKGFVAERIDIPVYGETDENGFTTITHYQAGVHINLRAYGEQINPAALSAFEEHPVTPHRTFA